MKEYLKSLRNQYYGEEAENYEKNRTQRKVWKEENAFVENSVKKIKPQALLDIPVGTGRFLPFYEQKQVKYVLGIDASYAMLKQAKRKKTKAVLMRGDAFTTGLPDNAVDCVVCFRFLHWIKQEDLHRLFKEFSRITSKHLIFNIRFYRNEDYAVHVNPKNGKEAYRHSETDFHNIRADFGLHLQQQKRRKSKEYETGYFLLGKVK